jgi:hypothetical protein
VCVCVCWGGCFFAARFLSRPVCVRVSCEFDGGSFTRKTILASRWYASLLSLLLFRTHREKKKKKLQFVSVCAFSRVLLCVECTFEYAHNSARCVCCCCCCCCFWCSHAHFSRTADGWRTAKHVSHSPVVESQLSGAVAQDQQRQLWSCIDSMERQRLFAGRSRLQNTRYNRGAGCAFAVVLVREQRGGAGALVYWRCRSLPITISINTTIGARCHYRLLLSIVDVASGCAVRLTRDARARS